MPHVPTAWPANVGVASARPSADAAITDAPAVALLVPNTTRADRLAPYHADITNRSTQLTRSDDTTLTLAHGSDTAVAPGDDVTFSTVGAALPSSRPDTTNASPHCATLGAVLTLPDAAAAVYTVGPTLVTLNRPPTSNTTAPLLSPAGATHRTRYGVTYTHPVHGVPFNHARVDSMAAAWLARPAAATSVAFHCGWSSVTSTTAGDRYASTYTDVGTGCTTVTPMTLAGMTDCTATPA